MGFRVSDALNMDILKKANVLAGYSALDNEIKWTNILEILDDLSQLRSGEFLITTAFGLDTYDAETQLKLVERLKKAGLSALAVQTGYYIKKVPKPLIRFCDEHNLPLIHLPSELSFGDLTRALLQNLFSFDKEAAIRSKAASDAIYGIMSGLPASGKPVKDNLDILNCPWNARFVAAVVDIDKKGQQADFIRERITNLLQIALKERSISAVVGVYHNMVVVFLPVDNESLSLTDTRIKRIFDEVLDEISGSLSGIEISAGIGNVYGGADTLTKSFDDAKKALATAKNKPEFGPVTMYKDLGVFRLLMDVANQETLVSFVNDTLGELAEPIDTQKLNLLETLKCYLSTKNANKTAQELLIHRHTLKYRLNKIRELTGLDPENGNDQTVLGIALSVLDFLRTMKQH
jgi:purine catabolism regulator